MDWFEKIKKMTEKEDSSRDLKRGEIKSILIEHITSQIPDFKFITYRNGTYFFERVRKIDGYNLFETLHISFRLKDKNFECSVLSTLNPKHRFVSSYTLGILTNHIDLIALKKKTEVIPIDQAYYFHNGKIQTTTKTVHGIVADYKKYGLSFLDKRFKDLKTNEIFKQGLKLYAQIVIDKKKLKEQVEFELKQNDYATTKVKHQLYLDLKARLQSIPGQGKDLRKKIPGFAYSLLEFYWEN